MIRLTKVFLILLSINIYGQTNDQTTKWKTQVLNNSDLYKQEFKDSLTEFDFGSLWTHTDNSSIYGFIGDNYQRIRIKILTVIKDTIHSETYHIFGKSMVKNNICQFSGTIKITTIRVFKNKHWGVDDEYKDKGIKEQGILIAEYHFAEDSNQIHSGAFDGILSTSFYIDKRGQLKYDDIEKYSDDYCNNQFVGNWTSFKNNSKKICNWGDQRIPFSGNFDIGAGGFSPDDKYLKYGWQTVRDAYWTTTPSTTAKQEEDREWWK